MTEITKENDLEKTEKTQIELAREAGNTWDFNGVEKEMFVADGQAHIGVAIIDPKTRQPSNVTMIHNLKWEKNDPFLIREQNFKTVLKSIGKSTEQEINTTNLTEANAKLYAEIVQSGEMIIPAGNGETSTKEISRAELLEFARLYPESASEVIETWFENWHFEVVDEENGSFDWLFQAKSVVKVYGWIGDRENPLREVILTFKAPTSEERSRYENERQIIKQNRISDQKIAEVRMSFIKKIQYGKAHLFGVEGIAVGAPGVKFTNELKERFITFMCPVIFGDAVDVMHESFDFTQGKAASN